MIQLPLAFDQQVIEENGSPLFTYSGDLQILPTYLEQLKKCAYFIRRSNDIEELFLTIATIENGSNVINGIIVPLNEELKNYFYLKNNFETENTGYSFYQGILKLNHMILTEEVNKHNINFKVNMIEKLIVDSF